jgi:hypothetical protein
MEFNNEEKERFLAIASPEEWDTWLTKMGDFYSPKGEDTDYVNSCLFCAAFGGDCHLCQANEGGMDHFYFRGCWLVPETERVDRAIWRLSKAGLWN